MAEETEQKTLYIFIDESGNFDFTVSGTKFFTMTAVSTLSPLQSREELLRRVYEMKYKGWTNGQDDYFFHATEDRQETRDWFFAALKKLDFDIDTIIAQKNKTHPSLYTKLELSNGRFSTIRSEERFYDKMSQMLLQYVFRRYEGKDGIEKIVVVLGSIFTEKKRGDVLKSLKRYLKQNFKKPFYVFFRSTASDINCQIADYCGWAIYVRAERGEARPWGEIKDKVKSCFDVFRTGKRTYYDYKS